MIPPVFFFFFSIYTSPGKRVFDVYVENSLRSAGFDAVKIAGPNTAVVVEQIVAITDGVVTIKLVKGIENPFISGIEIIATTAPVTPLSVPPAPIRINVGGGQFVDPTGNVWKDDAYFNSGQGTWDCPKAIASTDNDYLYCTYRWFNQAQPYLYQIPVPNGNYNVRLHFAEL